MVVIYWRDFFPASSSLRWPHFYKYLGLLLICSAPLIYFSVTQSEMMNLRYQRISIFSDNRGILAVFVMFLQNYFAHLMPDFLVVHGDLNLRHSVPYTGQLLKPEALALVFGLYGVMRRHRREDLLFLGWFLLAPVPAAMTNEGIPHALRSICILPVLQIIAACGCIRVVEYFQFREKSGVIRSHRPRRLVITAWLAAFVIFSGVFLTELFIFYPRDSAPWWEYGYREAFQYIKKHQEKYEEIVISGWSEYPEIQVLFWTDQNLRAYQKTQSIPGYEFLPFGQRAFPAQPAKGRPALYLLTPVDYPSDGIVKEIKYPDGLPAWYLVEGKS
jgi:hypothetical protein